MDCFVTVKITEDELLEMLVERVKFWNKEPKIVALYEQMYESIIEGGCFEGAELDIKAIVDNDYVNYTSVIEEGEEDYEMLMQLHEDGECDVSCQTSYSFIEAVDEENGFILVRW